MSSARTGEPPPVTPTDLEIARRMARTCGVSADADDIAQEATIAIACYGRPLRIPPGRTAEDARRFVLRTITRRGVARHHAALARTRIEDLVSMREQDEHAGHLERWKGTAPSIEEQILERGRRTLLRAAVDQLRTDAPDLYEVMQGELDGVSIPGLASRLGIPLNTLYTRIRRGRATLRAQLRRWEAEARREASPQLDAARRERERWR